MDLFNNWEQTKAELVEGLSGEKAKSMNTILANQRAFMLAEEKKRRSLKARWKRVVQRVQFWLFLVKLRKTNPYIDDMHRILIPMIRRIIPGTISEVPPPSPPVWEVK